MHTSRTCIHAPLRYPDIMSLSHLNLTNKSQFQLNSRRDEDGQSQRNTYHLRLSQSTLGPVARWKTLTVSPTGELADQLVLHELVALGQPQNEIPRKSVGLQWTSRWQGPY